MPIHTRGRNLSISAGVFLPLLLSVSGCSEALPREQPIQEVGDALLRAERAANEAAAAAAKTREESLRQSKLLAELREVRAQAEEARRSCEGTVRRIDELERSRAEARRLQAKRQKEAAAVAAAATPTPTPEPERPKDPEYSASDAPLESASPSHEPAPAPEHH